MPWAAFNTTPKLLCIQSFPGCSILIPTCSNDEALVLVTSIRGGQAGEAINVRIASIQL